MAQFLDLAKNAMMAMPRESLLALRGALVRDLGPNAASYLQEAGYAGGPTLHEAFARWLEQRGLDTPEALPTHEFGRRATEFLRDAGWGSIALGTLHEGVATIDSEDWAEADERTLLEFPGCHMTTGMFADFFGRLAGSEVAVMEVECRSMGAPRCRFLMGSPAVMQAVYDEMGRGISYEEARV